MYPLANSTSHLRADDWDIRHGWNFRDPMVDETAIRGIEGNSNQCNRRILFDNLFTQTPAIVFGAVWAISRVGIAEHKATNSSILFFMFLNACSTIYRKQGSWLVLRIADDAWRRSSSIRRKGFAESREFFDRR